MGLLFVVLGLFPCLVSSTSQGLFPVVDVSRLESTEQKCDAALTTLRQGLLTHQLWAHTMVDAGVKSPVGLLSQTLVQFGDFDECLGLGPPLEPQYCLFNISPTQPDNSSWSMFRWALCVPAACSVPALRHSLQTYMDQEQERGEEVEVDLSPAACTSPATRASSFDTPAIIYCSVWAVIIILVIVATVRDSVSKPDYNSCLPPKSVSECLSLGRSLSFLPQREMTIAGVNLNPLCGLYCLSFLAVTCGHRFIYQYTFLVLTNFQAVEDIFGKPWYSMWVANINLFVDVFFFLSAYLLGLRYYQMLDKSYTSPLMVYFYRLSRLLPSYAVVVFMAATLMSHMGDGPLWNMFIKVQQQNCRDNWWTSLLFIHNYVEKEHMCLIHTWYISCDVQLFACGTLLVLLLHKSPGIGGTLTVLLFIASVFAPFLATYLYELKPTLQYNVEYSTSEEAFWDLFLSVYSQGHYRGALYIIGLLTGVYVYQHKSDEPLTKRQTYMLETVGLIFCLPVYWSGALFYVMSEPPSILQGAIYAAFFHIIFGLGLAFIIVSWSIGQQTLLCRICSSQVFVPLSKLTYCAYLLTSFPQYASFASSRAPLYLSFQEMISWVASDLIICFSAALVIYLVVESPARYLSKYLTYSGARKSHHSGKA